MASKRHFAIAKGKKTGVFLNTPWEDIQPLVSGVSGALYKGFYTAEEAEEWYNSHSAPDVERGGLVAYVDGSNSSEGHEVSWAYVLGIEDDYGQLMQVLECQAAQVGEGDLRLTGEDYQEALEQRNVFGELMAAQKAAVASRAYAAERLILLHDYIGISRYASGAWPNRRTEMAEQYYLFMQGFSREVDFVHVKGHTGVAGNEAADALADFALGRSSSLPKVHPI